MGRNRERFFRSEPLEPRILLAANLDFLASASTPQQLTLLADSTRVQIVASNDPSQVLASELLANITGGVRVAGNGFDLQLTIDASLPAIAGGVAFDGGTGVNTLIGPAANATWTVPGTNTGTLAYENAAVQFTGVENLTGGASGSDRFIVLPSGRLSGTLRGQPNDADSLTVELQANVNTQTLALVAGATPSSGMVQRNGVTAVAFADIPQAIGLTVVTTPLADSVEMVTGQTAGTLDVRSTNAVATFAAVNVTLRTGVIVGLDLAGGSDSLTIPAATMDQLFLGGEMEADGGAGANTVVSQAMLNAWSITALNETTLNDVVRLSNVQNLTGDAGRDQFIFANGAALNGTVDGGGGQNTLDYSDYQTPVFVNYGTNAATGTLSALHFDTLVGGAGSDTITGPTIDSIWRIDSENAGVIENAGTTVLSFSAIENLTGAATRRDVFIVEKEGRIAGTVAGSSAGLGGLIVQNPDDEDDSFTVVNPESGGQSKTVTVHAKTVTYAGLNPLVHGAPDTDAVIAGGEVDGQWRLGDATASGFLTLSNLSGRFFDAATGTLSTSLTFPKPTSSLTLALGEAATALTLEPMAGPLHVAIQAGEGLNTLRASDGAHHVWTLTGFNTGTVDGYGATVAFSGIGTLIGGDQDDTFVYANNAAGWDGIDGGEGGMDSVDYRGTTSGVTVRLGVGITNIDTVIGGSGVDTLIGVADDNDWTISSANSGHVVTSRHSVTELDAATVVDVTARTIRFPIGKFFSNGERVTYVSDLTGDTSGLMSNQTYFVRVINASTIQLSLAEGGPAIALGNSVWANGHSLLIHEEFEINRVTFSGFENLLGNVGDDAFVLEDAGVTGFLDGSAGDNRVDYSPYTAAVTVNLGPTSAGSTTGAAGGIRNMTSIVGSSGVDTLLGPDLNATWEITGVDSGSIDRVTFTGNGVTLARAVTFAGFENLTGESGYKDAFIVRAGGRITGQIQGGADRTASLAIEDPAQLGHLAIVMPSSNGAGTIAANTIYTNTSAVSFAGIGEPFESDTSVTGVLTLSSNLTGVALALTQNVHGNLTLGSVDASVTFWNYATSQFDSGSLTAAIPIGTQRVELAGGGSFAIGGLNLAGASLTSTDGGDYVFTGNVLTGGGSISITPPDRFNNETSRNTDSTITVNAGVVLNTRRTNNSGTSIEASGDITLEANSVTIHSGAQLLSFDDRASPSSAGIPRGLRNPSVPANKWLPGKLYRDIPTTTSGAGSGLRVDVITDNEGNPTVILRSPGSGYAVGDTVTISHPNTYLTGSTSFHNGSDLTAQVNGVQGLGGSITLSAYHHAQAIAYSYNPIDVAISVGAGALIKGRDVQIIADADNTRIFDDSQDPLGLLRDGLTNSLVKQKSEALLDFLINFRLLVGVSLSEASATVDLAAGAVVEAVQGNVFTEAFARSQAKALALGLSLGFTYGRSESTADIDVQGTVQSRMGSVNIVATTANTVVSSTKTTNVGALKRLNPFSISGAVTEGYSHSTVMIGQTAVISAAEDVHLWAANAKNLSTEASASSDNSKLGISFAMALDDATADVVVSGRIQATHVDIVAQTMADKDKIATKFQNGQPIRSNAVNYITTAIQTTRVVSDTVAGSPDATSALGALIGTLFKTRSDRNYGQAAANAGETIQEGHSVGVISASFGWHSGLATAKVTGTAVIEATGKVDVHANVVDRPDMTSQGLAAVMKLPGVTLSEDGKLSVGIAIGYGEHTNKAVAKVEDGARIDAGGKLDVAANTKIPYEIPWQNLRLSDTLKTSEQVVARLLQQLGDDNLGANDYFTSFAQSTATGNRKGFAVSGNIMALNNGAEARIETGARINQNGAMTGERDVSVTSKIDAMALNLAGNFPNLLDAVLGQDRKQTVSNSGKESGFGGAFSVLLYDNTTLAVIESGAAVRSRDLLVDAQADTKTVALGVTGGKAGKTAINGAVNYIGLDDTTLAQIGQGATITATGKVDCSQY